MITKAYALMAGTFAASAAYQWIVFDYTTPSHPPVYGDWHRPLLLGATIAASVLAFWHAGSLLSAGKNEDAVVCLIAASPAFILLSYVAQSQNAAQKGYVNDFRRETVHIYSGLCLLIMAISVMWSVGYFTFHKLTGKKA